MSKIVPSPDWFVGLDSLNLCENGHFVDSVTVEVNLKFNEIEYIIFNFFLFPRPIRLMPERTMGLRLRPRIGRLRRKGPFFGSPTHIRSTRRALFSTRINTAYQLLHPFPLLRLVQYVKNHFCFVCICNFA